MESAIRTIGTARAAEMLRMTSRRVVGLCSEGKLAGAVRDGKSWKIPEQSVQELMSRMGIYSEPDRQKLLPCAPGNTSFPDIAENCYLTDKTLLIRDLFTDAGKVVVFLQPPGFGKTLMLSMLQSFLEIGNEYAGSFFQDSPLLKRPGEQVYSLQGKYPVIRISFKDVGYVSWNESFEAIRIILQDEFRRHRGLPESRQLSASQKEYLRRMEYGILSEVELSRSVLNLTDMLFQHYGMETVLLIDAFDDPAEYAERNGFGQQMREFLRALFGYGIKDNPFLKKAILTGVYPHQELTENLTALVFDGMGSKYGEYFGLTQQEVRKMAEYYGVENRLDEIRSWFGGYRYGNSAVFNPGAVSGYFAGGCVPERAFSRRVCPDTFGSVFSAMSEKTAGRLAKLLQGETVKMLLDESDGGDLLHTEDFFLRLLYAGLLTAEKSPAGTGPGFFACVKIPNRSAYRTLAAQVYEWAEENGAAAELSELRESVFLEDCDKFLDGFCKTCLKTVSGLEGLNPFSVLLVYFSSILGEEFRIIPERKGEELFSIRLYSLKRGMPDLCARIRSVPGSRKYMLADIAEELAKQEKSNSAWVVGIAHCGDSAELCINLSGMQAAE